MLGVGAVAPGRPPVELAAEAVPQMPAWLCALAILARSGPFCDVAVLFTPALVLAVLHRLPKASPPPPCAGFGPGLPSEAMDVDEVYDGVIPLRGVDAADEKGG